MKILCLVVWLSILAAGYTILQYHECRVAETVCRTAGLPRQTRGVLLPGLVGYENFLSQQERRFAILFNTVSAGRYRAIFFLATRASYSVVGVLGRNRVYLGKKYQCGRLSKDLLVPPWRGAISVESPRMEQQIRKLCMPGMDWRQTTFSNLRILR